MQRMTHARLFLMPEQKFESVNDDYHGQRLPYLVHISDNQKPGIVHTEAKDGVDRKFLQRPYQKENGQSGNRGKIKINVVPYTFRMTDR